MIIVDADKEDKTQLVLAGATIHSSTCAPLYIRQADKVFVTLAQGTENVLSAGESFVPMDENNIDGAIFSKEDLTINGSGELRLASPAGHGIVSKDDLTLAGGSITVECAGHGLAGKDSVAVADTTLSVTSGKDGIHGENEEDAALGNVLIESGSLVIDAQGDGISAGGRIQILDGSIQILAGGGSANAEAHTSENWGGFAGMGGPGAMGGPGNTGWGGTSIEDTIEDSTSMKGIKAAGELQILGGSFDMDSADDGVHSNSDLTVNGGTFHIASGDDGFHADQTLTFAGGAVEITESYEGLEGLHIRISAGEIILTSADDGLNAAGGADQSGFGGHRGGDMFGGMGMGGNSNGSVVISGGTVDITASGDGIDANGYLEITGGFVTVCGPTQGDTATLDYDTTATISGGTFIGTGASGMAQTFSESPQGVIAVSIRGTMEAGTRITLTDGEGNQLFSCAPKLSFSVVIFSSPDIVKGNTYTITAGEASAQIEV